MDVRPSGGNQGIVVGPLANDHLTILGQLNRYFGLGIGSPGNRVNLVQLQFRLMRNELADALENRVYRTGPRYLGRFNLTVNFDHNMGGLRADRARHNAQRDEFDAFVLGRQLIIDKGDYVLVEYVLLLVGEILQALERILEGVVANIAKP